MSRPVPERSEAYTRHGGKLAQHLCACGQVADLDGEVCAGCALKAWDRQCALLRAEGRRLILRGRRRTALGGAR